MCGKMLRKMTLLLLNRRKWKNASVTMEWREQFLRILVSKTMNFGKNLVFLTNFKIGEDSHKFYTLFGISQINPNKIFSTKSYFM